MVCYVMVFYVVLCCAMLSYVTLYYVVLCYVTGPCLSPNEIKNNAMKCLKFQCK